LATILPYEISPGEVKQNLDAGVPLALIDVREVHEHATARIENAELIPMNSLPAHLQRLESLAGARRLVVLCHHGMRSMTVVNWLRQQGIDNCQSMAGGIERWSNEVDPAVPRY
jgi:rhodanese-related sulfurtransferase